MPLQPPALHLSLIGFMGSGKSTLGRALADRLDRPFVDTDAEVERMLGLSIREIFETQGEAVFREAEQDVLSDALKPDEPIVLATGGGTPCADGAMEWMRSVREKAVAHRPLGQGAGDCWRLPLRTARPSWRVPKEVAPRRR